MSITPSVMDVFYGVFLFSFSELDLLITCFDCIEIKHEYFDLILPFFFLDSTEEVSHVWNDLSVNDDEGILVRCRFKSLRLFWSDEGGTEKCHRLSLFIYFFINDLPLKYVQR